jgi:glutamate--cysteine ligase
MTTPTRDIDESAPRIRDKRELVERLAGGSKPKAQWRIGTEHEKFGFIEKTLRPCRMKGPASIRGKLLEGISQKFGWAPIMEGEYIIGLKKDMRQPEPGAGRAVRAFGRAAGDHSPDLPPRLHPTCARRATSREPMGVDFLGLGFSPLWSLDETP